MQIQVINVSYKCKFCLICLPDFFESINKHREKDDLIHACTLGFSKGL